MSFMDAPDLKSAKKARNKKPLEDQFDELAKSAVVSRVLRSVKTTAKGKVIVSFIKKITMPLKEGQEKNDEHQIQHTVKSPHKAHKDFYSAMKKLKKHALALNEIYPDEAKGGDKNYSVTGFNLAGDLDMKTARVDLVLGKLVERTGKIIPMPTGQVALYESPDEGGGSDYPDVEDLATAVDKAAEQVFKYVDGTYADVDQLPLF